MAKPQLENGHTRIANEILEHLMRMYLPPNQWQVLLCIIRKTYGFNKKVDWIANFQIIEATGLIKSTVSRALKLLEQQKLISRNNKRYIGFQKDWEKWQKVSSLANKLKLAELSTLDIELAEQLTREKLAIPQPKLADRKLKLAIQPTKVSSPRITQKTKETITKETIQKKVYGIEFHNVFLADNEYKKLLDKLGETKTKEWIEELSFGIESKGYKFESHYATILNWNRRGEKDKKGGQGGTHRGDSKATTAKEIRDSIGKPLR